jgi:Zn-dependent protease
VETQPTSRPESVGTASGLDGERAPVASVAIACPRCGTEVAPALLACPACGWLRYSTELKRLAAEADAHASAGQFTAELVAWRTALTLLPASSQQHATIARRADELSRKGPASSEPQRPAWTKRAGAGGAIALFLWKFKVALLFLLTKGKLLLLGLTKAGTFLSMLLSLGVYWQLYGWKWALGVVASIYVHEMGHVAMLRRYGIDATAPMFIPGFGALIRARFYPNDVIGEARVGLAGPIWGLAAAVVCFTVYSVTGSHAWGAIAVIGAYINLFNLTPVWQLDGAHGFKALTKEQRWIVVLALAAAWFLTREPLLILLLVMAAIAAMNRAAAEQPDRRTLLEFLVLIAALSALAALPISVQSALK